MIQFFRNNYAITSNIKPKKKSNFIIDIDHDLYRQLNIGKFVKFYDLEDEVNELLEYEQGAIRDLSCVLTTAAPGITLTVKDSEDSIVYRYFKSQIKQLYNPDGTVNSPTTITRDLYIIDIDDYGNEKFRRVYKAWPYQIPNRNGDVEGHTENDTFEVKFSMNETTKYNNLQ